MESPHTPFDEKAALEELERLRDAIEAARRARLAKSDEFEEFVKGFKKPAIEKPAIELPTPAPVPELLTLTPAPEPEPPALMEMPERKPEPAPELQPQMPRPTAAAKRGDPVVRVLGTLAIAAVAVIGALVYWSRGPSTRVVEAPANQAPASSAPTPAASAPTSPVQAPPPSDAVPAAAVTVELRTLQPVWMRVTVDGQKQREGTVPAGERLQLRGDRAIVIRAGNGGDVVVKNANGEAPLGVAGQPITFTFTKAGGKS